MSERRAPDDCGCDGDHANPYTGCGLICQCAGPAQCRNEMTKEDGLCDFCRAAGGKSRDN